MKYAFGQYELSTFQSLGGNLFFPRQVWKGKLYFRPSWFEYQTIAESGNYYSEARLINWAASSIRVHQKALKGAKQAANV